MSYRQNVKILMGLKAYEYLEQTCLTSEDESVQEMVTQPSQFKKSETEVLIGWDDYDWDRLEYQSIYEVERALSQLDHFVENDPQTYPLEDYFYKIIRIGSELKFSEKTNDEYGEYTSDFYVQANFSM